MVSPRSYLQYRQGVSVDWAELPAPATLPPNPALHKTLAGNMCVKVSPTLWPQGSAGFSLKSFQQENKNPMMTKETDPQKYQLPQFVLKDGR